MSEGAPKPAERKLTDTTEAEARELMTPNNPVKKEAMRYLKMLGVALVPAGALAYTGTSAGEYATNQVLEVPRELIKKELGRNEEKLRQIDEDKKLPLGIERSKRWAKRFFDSWFDKDGRGFGDRESALKSEKKLIETGFVVSTYVQNGMYWLDLGKNFAFWATTLTNIFYFVSHLRQIDLPRRQLALDTFIAARRREEREAKESGKSPDEIEDIRARNEQAIQQHTREFQGYQDTVETVERAVPADIRDMSSAVAADLPPTLTDAERRELGNRLIMDLVRARNGIGYLVSTISEETLKEMRATIRERGDSRAVEDFEDLIKLRSAWRSSSVREQE